MYAFQSSLSNDFREPCLAQVTYVVYAVACTYSSDTQLDADPRFYSMLWYLMIT